MKGYIAAKLVTGETIKSKVIDNFENLLTPAEKDNWKETIGSMTANSGGNIDVEADNGDWIVMPLSSVLYLRFVTEPEMF